MKYISVFLLLCYTSVALADDAAIARHINAHLQMLGAQVSELNSALWLLKNEALSEADKFERIGQPSFSAIDDALKNAGVTMKQFYQFKDDYADEIEQWLMTNSLQANQIDSLQSEYDVLMSEYDQLINLTNKPN